MPAWKKRPDKHGLSVRVLPAAPTAVSDSELVLINKLAGWEREEPRGLHYVGWPDVATAHMLVKRSLIVEGPATECYYVTDLFRQSCAGGVR